MKSKMSLVILWKDCEDFYGVSKWKSTKVPPKYFLKGRNCEEVMRAKTNQPRIVRSLFYEILGKKKKRHNSRSNDSRSKCKDLIRAREVFCEKLNYVDGPYFNINDHESDQVDSEDELTESEDVYHANHESDELTKSSSSTEKENSEDEPNDDYHANHESDDESTESSSSSTEDEPDVQEIASDNESYREVRSVNRPQRKRKRRVIDEDDEPIMLSNKRVKVNEISTWDNSSNSALSEILDYNSDMEIEAAILEKRKEYGLCQKKPTGITIKETIEYLKEHGKGKIRSDIKEYLNYLKEHKPKFHDEIWKLVKDKKAKDSKIKPKKNNAKVTRK